MPNMMDFTVVEHNGRRLRRHNVGNNTLSKVKDWYTRTLGPVNQWVRIITPDGTSWYRHHQDTRWTKEKAKK